MTDGSTGDITFGGATSRPVGYQVTSTTPYTTTTASTNDIVRRLSCFYVAPLYFIALYFFPIFYRQKIKKNFFCQKK